ncbi:MAG: hypothetical protein KDJ52_35890, partial [Anaerolineae bacterium]|nr:hypothetical protein [Anaerolineae bacterium]
GWLHVTLYWTAAAPISSDVMPVVQLVGPEGVWGVNLDRAGDALKVFPPTQWFNADRASQPIIRHDLDVNLNPVTPPGEYLLVVKVGEEQFVLGEVGVR